MNLNTKSFFMDDKKAQEMAQEALRNNGIEPIDLSQTEARIGNTQRSDFEFYRQLKEAEQQKEKMDQASTADGTLDAISVLTNHYAEKGEQKDDPVMDYISSKTPTADYTDPAEPVDEPVEEAFSDNADDVTQTDEADEPVEQIQEDYIENVGDVAQIDNKPDTTDDFRENADDITH